jgi:uncharacterized membrane protein required for colicin V production
MYVIVGSYRGIYMKETLLALSFVLTIYVILKNRKVLNGLLKELSSVQILGVAISYIVTITIAFIFIYYGGNWIAGYFPNMVVRYIIQLIVVCITLYLCGSVLGKALQKTTKGVLPMK